jgi:hypothetical protein
MPPWSARLMPPSEGGLQLLSPPVLNLSRSLNRNLSPLSRRC